MGRLFRCLGGGGGWCAGWWVCAGGSGATFLGCEIRGGGGVFLGWFSWQHVVVGTLLAFVLNAVVVVVVLLSRRGGRDSDIPFGPWVVAGAVLAVVLL